MRRMSGKRNGYKQRVRFGKSSCVEPNSARRTARVTAALRRYKGRRAAHSFADLASTGVVEEAKIGRAHATAPVNNPDPTHEQNLSRNIYIPTTKNPGKNTRNLST